MESKNASSLFSNGQNSRSRSKYGNGDKSKEESYPTEYEALLGVQKNLPYPTSVFFIVVNEFCERFSFYGMRAILTLYLVNVLKYTENTTTIIFHAFVMFSYLTCVPGAIIADSWLGKFNTIFYLSVVYALGNATLCFASVGTTPSFSWIPVVPLSFIGLALVASGTGGIKPCVSAFGGDQFHLPGQEKGLEQFFFIFYFAINVGSMISTFVTPILRKDVSCLGLDTCYPLAFGLPAILMVTALLIFLMGKPFYKMKRPTGNIIVQIVKCIWHALRNRCKAPSFTVVDNEHWLDHAIDKYDEDFIQDVKKLLSIMILFLPLPVFWALFEQQGSRWTLQATRMNGFIFNGWIIIPDQMQVVNSFLVLLFIPLFDQLIYPAFGKCHLLKKSLQRMAVGGFLASASFVLAGLVELSLEPTFASLPGPSECQFNFVNTLPCQLNVSLTSIINNTTTVAGQQSTTLDSISLDDQLTKMFTQQHLSLAPNENGLFKHVPANINYSIKLQPYQNSTCTNNDGLSLEFKPDNIFCELKKSQSILIGLHDVDSNHAELKYLNGGDDLVKSQDGNAKLKILLDGQIDTEEENFKIVLHGLKSTEESFEFNFNISDLLSSTSTIEMQPDMYSVSLLSSSSSSPTDSIILGEIDVDAGGVYLLVIYPTWSTNANIKTKMKLIEQTVPNTIHMLLLLPQYFVITTAEVLFAITGYAFSYSEAPQSMKSVIQAVWLLTNAAGSFIVILVTELNLFPRQMIQYFFFSGLMFIATVIFIFLAYRYVPIQRRKPSSIFMKRTTLPSSTMTNFFQLSENELTDFDEDQ